MRMMIYFIIASISFSAWAGKKVAVAKILRGEVKVLTLGKTTPLKVNDWVESGAVVKTEDKSFVKLVFIDKSQMNISPNSEMKIESFSGNDSGVIDLVKGKIRSQVTKDYLQIQDKDKSKLFIKTNNAVMGVRGTDFMIASNGKNTTTVLFEGEIVFNKLEQRGHLSSSALEEIVDRGVRLHPNEFSVMEANRPLPTVPALLNIQQREHLEKNKDFDSNRAPSNASAVDKSKSVVPAGLNGQQVSNSVDTLKNEVAQVAAISPVDSNKIPPSSDPEGYVKGDLIKPANGSYVHVESGIIIPPGPDSVLDSNTNTYIPGQDSGNVAIDGSYIPPKNVEITDDGKVLVAVPGTDGPVVTEVPPPAPVVSSTSTTIGQTATQIATGPIPPPPTNPPPAELSGVDPRFSPSGGYVGSNDPARVLSGGSKKVDTTIVVRPQP